MWQQAFFFFFFTAHIWPFVVGEAQVFLISLPMTVFYSSGPARRDSEPAGTTAMAFRKHSFYDLNLCLAVLV